MTLIHMSRAYLARSHFIFTRCSQKRGGRRVRVPPAVSSVQLACAVPASCAVPIPPCARPCTDPAEPDRGPPCPRASTLTGPGCKICKHVPVCKHVFFFSMNTSFKKSLSLTKWKMPMVKSLKNRPTNVHQRGCIYMQCASTAEQRAPR